MTRSAVFFSIVFCLALSFIGGSCDDDDSLTISVENATGDSIYVFVWRAADAISVESAGGECNSIVNYKSIASGSKAVAWDNSYYIEDAYKVYVVRKNRGDNFLKRPSLPMSFDYTHVFNYSDLEALGFCVRITDSDVK